MCPAHASWGVAGAASTDDLVSRPCLLVGSTRQRGDYSLANEGATSEQLLNHGTGPIMLLLAALAARAQAADHDAALPADATLVERAAAAIMTATKQQETLKAILFVAAFVSFALADADVKVRCLFSLMFRRPITTFA